MARMKDIDINYGSSNLRMEYLHDEKGKKIKDNSLFDNIYDYLSACNNDGNKVGNNWHGQKMSLLEQTIRKKQKKT